MLKCTVLLFENYENETSSVVNFNSNTKTTLNTSNKQLQPDIVNKGYVFDTISKDVGIISTI